MNVVSWIPPEHRALAILNGANTRPELRRRAERLGYQPERRVEAGEFAATLFRHRDPKRPLVLSYPGTNTWRDMLENLEAWGFEKPHPQFPQAYRLLEDTLREYPNQGVIVTGHSLGGALARAARERLSVDEALNPRQVSFVAFNAPNIDPALYLPPETRQRATKPRLPLTAYRHPFDPIAGLFPNPHDILVRSGRPWPPLSKWVGSLEALLRLALRRLNVHGIHKFA